MHEPELKKGIENGFDDWDLKNGIQYCEELIQHENITNEPMDGFSLSGYIEWAKRKLKE